jgi:hypothetical protein
MFCFVNRALIRRKNDIIAEQADEVSYLQKRIKSLDSDLKECNQRAGYNFEHRTFRELKVEVEKLRKQNDELKAEINTQKLLDAEKYTQLKSAYDTLQLTLKTKLCRVGR